MRRSLSILVLVVAVAGCAVSTPVQPTATGHSGFDGAVYPGETTALEKSTPGAEQFRVFQQAATGFVSLQTVRAGVQKVATEFCSRKAKIYRGVSETAAVPPFILGNFPRVELQFECVDAPPPQRALDPTPYEKLATLKQLLDNGTLTQAEFDREKSKILGTH